MTNFIITISYGYCSILWIFRKNFIIFRSGETSVISWKWLDFNYRFVICQQGHYRRGVALSALGRHEEALFALCISVAIDKNPQAVRHELIKVCRFLLNLNVTLSWRVTSTFRVSKTRAILRQISVKNKKT